MKLISLPQIYEKLNKDQAYISRLMKENKIKTILARRKNGKLCKAISLEDWAKLLKDKPSLNSKPLTKKDVTLLEAAKILNMDQSNLRKMIVNLNIPIKYRSTGKARVLNCITKKQFKKVQEIVGQKTDLPIVN